MIKGNIKVNFMLISKINSNFNFRGQGVTDSGASVEESSFKIASANNQGIIIKKAKTTINTPGKLTFENSKDYVTRSVSKFAQNYYESDPKTGLTRLTMFAPGYVYKDEIVETPNLKGKDGKALSSISFANVKKMLLAQKIKLAKNFKFLVLQDSMGIGLSTIRNMVANDAKAGTEKMLTPGKNYCVMMTGGGCGIAQIEALTDGKILVKGAGSNYLSSAKQSLRVSDEGASVKAVLKEFGAHLFPENEKVGEELVQAGIGQIVQSEKVSVEANTKSQKLMDALAKTGKYILTHDKKTNNITFEIKPEFSKEFKTARDYSIRKYAHAIARFLPNRLAEGPNGLIITGPFAFGLDDCLKKNSSTTLPDLIKEEFRTFATKEYLNIMKKHNFKIICDREHFGVTDNTDCAEILNYVRTCGDRRNSLTVNLKAYKKFLAENAIDVAKKVR